MGFEQPSPGHPNLLVPHDSRQPVRELQNTQLKEKALVQLASSKDFAEWATMPWPVDPAVIVSFSIPVYMRDQTTCLKKLRVLIQTLPDDNLNLLKYLAKFLVLVSLREVSNKMSPIALGIVFGPNLFR